MNLKSFKITDLFTPETGEYHVKKDLDSGDIPLITCSRSNNGVAGYYDIPKQNQHSHAITVAYNGWYAFSSKFHPYTFGAKDDVAVLKPKQELDDKTLIYVAAMFNRERWRYSYTRKCFKNKLKSVEIDLPATSEGEVDEKKIAEVLEPIKAELPKRSKAGESEVPEPTKWEKKKISEYFDLQQGDFNSLPDESGRYPTVSRRSENNGITGYYKPPEGANIYTPPKITVSTVSGKAFVQNQEFISSDKVVILLSRSEYIKTA